MNFRLKARDLPGRIAAGAHIRHAGLEKWHADEARAKGVHKAPSKPGSVWPTPAGTAVGKDVWMLGNGLGLLAGSLGGGED